MPKVLETFKNILESSENEETWADSADGITYVQRTLLFKSFHNAVDRKLCGEGWTRLGRWFINISEGTNNNGKQSQKQAAISLR